MVKRSFEHEIFPQIDSFAILVGYQFQQESLAYAFTYTFIGVIHQKITVGAIDA